MPDIKIEELKEPPSDEIRASDNDTNELNSMDTETDDGKIKLTVDEANNKINSLKEQFF